MSWYVIICKLFISELYFEILYIIATKTDTRGVDRAPQFKAYGHCPSYCFWQVWCEDVLDWKVRKPEDAKETHAAILTA